MSYVPAPARYERLPYRRCGRSGLELPAISLGLWHNFGGVDALETRPRDPAPRLRPRHHPFRPRQQLRPAYGSAEENFGRMLRGRLPALPRRADHLHQGRLRHVARAVRRVGLAQVPARQPRPEPAAHGARLRRHLLFAPLRSATRRSRRPWARSTPRCAQGKALYVGISSYSPEPTRQGGGDPASARHALPDPPALLLDAQPLDRATGCSTCWASTASAASRFSPLAQGMLTDKYLAGVPADSRGPPGAASLQRGS